MGNSSAITLSSKCLFLGGLLNSINSTSPAPQSSSVMEPECSFLAHLVTAGSVIYGHGIRPRCRAQETRAAMTREGTDYKTESRREVPYCKPVYNFCLPTPCLTPFTLSRRKNGTFIWFAFVFPNQGHLCPSLQKKTWV